MAVILQKIEIEQFGGLKDYVLELSGGSWYLFGENEAGKSTLCAFISAMFYGLPPKQRGGGLKGDSRSLYMPWGEAFMAGTLYFQSGGQDYVLRRRFGQTARGDRCSLLSAADWQEVAIGADELGQHFLGVGADAFSKTLFISQLGAAFEKGREDELMTRLSNLEHTGDEDASLDKALKELERAQHDLISKTGRGGVITQLDGEIEALQTELLEAKQKGRALQSLLEDIQRLSAEQLVAEQSLHALEEQRQKAAAFAAYEKREQARQQYRAQKARLETEQSALTAIQAERMALAEAAEGFGAVLTLESDVVLKLAEKEAACGVLEKQLAEQKALEQELADLQEQVRQNAEMRRGKGRLWCWPAAAAVLAAAVLLGVLLSPVLYLLVLLAPIPVFAASRSRRDNREQLALEARLSEKQAALERLAADNAEGRLTALREEITAVLQQAGADSLSQLADKLEEARGLRHKQAAAAEEEKRLAESTAALAQALSALTEPEPEEPPVYTGPPLEALDEERENRRRGQMERERQLAQMNARVENGFSGTRGVSILESELADCRQRRQELMEQYEAVSLAARVLADCAETLKSSFAPALNEASGRLISRLTDGRYQEVRVTDEYKMLLKTAAGSDIVPSDYVSAGTCDLLYFALRLAVLHTLYDEIPLLVLDDTFLQLDARRQQAAFSLLQQLPAGQILYFSCHRPPEVWSGQQIKELNNHESMTGGDKNESV